MSPAAPVADSPPVEPFPSAEDAHRAHDDLLAALPEEPGPDDLGRVTDFIRRAVATGAALDAPNKRKLVQGLIDYWAAALVAEYRTAERAGTAARAKPAATVLAPFAADTVWEVADKADRWLASNPNKQPLADRILLRLIRIPPDSDAPEPSPAPKTALRTCGPAIELDEVIDGLATAGVLRIVPAKDGSEEQVELRYPAMTRVWPRLRELLDGRRKFREVVRYWVGTGAHPSERDPAALLTGPLLDRARKYHDPNDQELEFLEACHGLELRKTRNYRLLTVGFAALALAAIVLAVTAWLGLSRARHEYDVRLEQERVAREIIELDATVQSTSTFAIASMILTEDPAATHAAKKVLILQALRQVLFARNDAAADAARRNFDLLKRELTTKRSVNQGWFQEFFDLDPDTSDEVGHRPDFDLITGGRPTDAATIEDLRPRIEALRRVSVYLREFIVIRQTREAIDTIRPEILGETAEVVRKLAAIAADGRPLADARQYQLAFWQLYSTSLVLVGDDRLEKDVGEIASALRSWEAVGKAAPQPVRTKLGAAAAAFDLQGRGRGHLGSSVLKSGQRGGPPAGPWRAAGSVRRAFRRQPTGTGVFDSRPLIRLRDPR
jgi:hypothetical protein